MWRLWWKHDNIKEPEPCKVVLPGNPRDVALALVSRAAPTWFTHMSTLQRHAIAAQAEASPETWTLERPERDVFVAIRWWLVKEDPA